MTLVRSPIRGAAPAVRSAFGRGGGRVRGLVLDADAVFRGAVLDASGTTGAVGSWDNDPASADRVGKYRAGGLMPLTSKAFASIFTFTRASGATDYGATGLLASVATDAIRMGYDPVTLAPQGWLIEGARTNLMLYSAALDNAGWTLGSATVNPNAAVALDGNTGADTLVESTANAIHQVYQQFAKAASALPYVLSVYVKSASTRNIRLQIGDGVSSLASVTVNPSDGSVVVAATAIGSFTSPVATVSYVGAGWYRVALSMVSSTGTVMLGQFQLANATANSYTGDGASGVYLWGAQLEQATTASSYIATTSASATRAVDSLTVAGGVFTGMFGAGAPQGTLVFDITPGQAAPSGVIQNIAQLDDGTDANRIVLRNPAGGLTVAGDVVVASAAAGPTSSAGSMVAGTTCRVGLRWGGGAIAVCVNGGSLQTLSATLPAGLTTLRLGGAVTAGSALFGRMRLARAFGYALSDADFQAAATLGA